jgi:hypothetical protein
MKLVKTLCKEPVSKVQLYMLKSSKYPEPILSGGLRRFNRSLLGIEARYEILPPYEVEAMLLRDNKNIVGPLSVPAEIINQARQEGLGFFVITLLVEEAQILRNVFPLIINLRKYHYLRN